MHGARVTLSAPLLLLPIADPTCCSIEGREYRSNWADKRPDQARPLSKDERSLQFSHPSSRIEGEHHVRRERTCATFRFCGPFRTDPKCAA